MGVCFLLSFHPFVKLCLGIQDATCMGMGLGNRSMGGDNFKLVFTGLGMDLPFSVYIRAHGHKATHIFDTLHSCTAVKRIPIWWIETGVSETIGRILG